VKNKSILKLPYIFKFQENWLTTHFTMMQNLNKNAECRGKYFIWLKENILHGSLLFIFNHTKPDTLFLICCKTLLDEKYFTLKIFSIKHFHFTVFIKHFYFTVFNCIIENNLEIII